MELTQEEFGEKIGLSKSGISNIENGTRNVSSRHIKLICNVFNVNESWLTTGIDDDVKFEKMGDEIAHFETFRKYLLSLGYSISIQKTDASSECIIQEMISADGTVVGASLIPNEESFTITLQKGKAKTILSDEQFNELQSNIENAVAFELFKHAK